MRLRLEVAPDGATVTIRADRYNPTLPPARLAGAISVAVETAMEAALTAAREAALAARDQEETQPGAPVCLSEVPVQPPAAEVDRHEMRVVAAAPAQVAPAGDKADAPSGLDALRAPALALLDDGLTDEQVCQRLGISRARLQRWDNPVEACHG